MKFTARYQPEAWVNNCAVEIDGAEEWDCTAFIVGVGPDTASVKLWHRAVGLEAGDDFRDDDDELRDDPAAPDFVREHSGPFTITVARVEVSA